MFLDWEFAIAIKNVVIGIHGLGEKPPAHVLRAWWLQSIREGAKRSQIELNEFEFELVYWADILHPTPQDPEVSDPRSPGPCPRISSGNGFFDRGD